MVITEPTVTSTRLLGLGLRLYLNNMQRMLTKVFLKKSSTQKKGSAGKVTSN